MKQKYYDEFQKLRLIDDELMELCFDDNNAAVEILVRVILGRDDLTITSAKTQVTMKGIMREVRLDVWASDKEGQKYNIEFQRKNKGAEPERARLNASMIDANILGKGEDYTALPEVYVIFITEHDVLGGGLPLYTIDRVISETGKLFGDRQHIVYVNGEHRNADTALGRLVLDLFCHNAEEMHYAPLAERVRHFKDNGKEIGEMSRFSEMIIRDEQKTIAQRMLEAGKVALSDIAKYTGLSISTVRRMAKKLETAQQA
jgi:hypothetical protein